ncbi:MAG TPA: response regulator transcription factor [Acidisarcina sp.]
MVEQIRVLISDDHPIVRKGLRTMIEEEEDIVVVAEAGDGEAALALIKKFHPQVAVLDIDMPKLDGFGVIREMKTLKLQTSVIFLTLHAEEDMFRAALEMGGRGYLLKDSAMQEIAVGVRAVAAGQLYLSSAMTGRLLRRPETPDLAPKNPLTVHLTPTEHRILQLIADGKSSKEIGAELSIHYRTVENHRTNICRKLSLDGANALLRFTLQHKACL